MVSHVHPDMNISLIYDKAGGFLLLPSLHLYYKFGSKQEIKI